MAAATKPPPELLQSTTAFTDPQAELDFIRRQAAVFGLDPNAVLAVAAHEGVTLPSEVGDSGTSFGPWQLHVGGRLPTLIAQRGPDYSQQWANSPAGLNYALAGISGVARGQSGSEAISNIVTKFERPAAPAPEIAASITTYQQGGLPTLKTGGGGGGFTGALEDIGKTGLDIVTGGGSGVLIGGGYIPGGPNVVGNIGSTLDVLKWPFEHNRILRFGEIVLGLVIAILGVLMLTRGLTLPVAAAAVARKVPT